MAQKRIYQIAKELNISYIEILDYLQDNNVDVDGHMSLVDEDVYNSILIEFSKEKKQIELLRSERARKAVIENKDSLEKEPVVDPIKDKEVGTPVQSSSDEQEKKSKVDLESKNISDNTKNETEDDKKNDNVKNDSIKKRDASGKDLNKLKKIDLTALTELINQKGKTPKIINRN